MNPTEQAMTIIAQSTKQAAPAQTRGEQAQAVAERYKAEVMVKREQAVRCPRDIMSFRKRLLKHCERYTFASEARYRKPVGGGDYVEGASIRFVKAALQCFGNVESTQQVIHDDDEVRIIRVTVTDLEENVQFSEDVQIAKTVERRSPRRGDVVISKRENSRGDIVHLVAANEDDLANKVSAAASKKLRNCGLSLLPPDIVDEALAACDATVRSGIRQDPEGQTKALVDAFDSVGVSADQLAEYLGHSALQCTPSEIKELRAVYSALKEGHTSWQSFVAERETVAEINEWEQARSGLADKLAKRKEQAQ